MVDLTAPYRRGEKADAAVLARLIDIAGEGIPVYLWSQSAVGGEDPLDIGTRRAAGEEGGFSYRNAFVVEADGRVAGMLLGYRQPKPYPDTNLLHIPAVVRPLIELEALVPGSWYINAMALFPEFQGRGLGSTLLNLAEALARESGATQLSVIAAAENEGACRLYERGGYRTVGRRPVVGFPCAAHGGDWVLMVKDLPE